MLPDFSFFGRRSQAVRPRFAKPPCIGSNPIVASKSYKGFLMNLRLILILSLFVASCSHVSKDIDVSFDDNTYDLLEKSVELSEKAYKTKSRSKKKKYAKEGILYASRCIKSEPEMVACYYYRSVNTGLFYQARIIGYQKGLKNMISDCNVIIKLNPNFEHAGAYLILGQIYSQVPKTAARPTDITRDLELAENHLKRAVSISPDYPENHLYLAKVQLDLGLDDEARTELLNAQKLMKKWKSSMYYNEWKTLANRIEKELKRNL